MRLSEAWLRCRQTKLVYPNHRLPPWLTGDATRDRSNRWLALASEQLSVKTKLPISVDSHLRFLDRHVQLLRVAPYAVPRTFTTRRHLHDVVACSSHIVWA